MYRTSSIVTAFAAAGLFALSGGCGATQAPTSTAKAHTAGGERNHAEHDHAAAGHDHHDHAELGPHGGQLVELGEEEFHAEIIHNDDTHAVSVYVLDGKAEDTVAIAAPSVTIEVDAGGAARRFSLPAVHLGQDDVTRTFCFEAVDEALCDALDEEGSKSIVSVEIDGKSFSGAFAHAHDHEHDHAHAHHTGRTR
ncbi:MAG TPA: hypothetical protein VF278_05695 [Pirellulales bacterium]